MSITVNEKLLTLREAGELCGVSERTMRRLVKSGQVPAIRLGPSTHSPIRVDPHELRAWLYADQEEAT